MPKMSCFVQIIRICDSFCLELMPTIIFLGIEKKKETTHLMCCPNQVIKITVITGYCLHWPDRLNPDWCRLRTGWLGCLAGEVLAEEAGVMVFGVTDTSQTGPSYSPLGTPLSSASCSLRKQTQLSWQWKRTRKYSMPQKGCRLYWGGSLTSCITAPAFHKTIIMKTAGRVAPPLCLTDSVPVASSNNNNHSLKRFVQNW